MRLVRLNNNIENKKLAVAIKSKDGIKLVNLKESSSKSRTLYSNVGVMIN